jgi:hypothetical protein
VDPLIALPQKRQEPSPEFISVKKSRLSLDDKDQKTKER